MKTKVNLPTNISPVIIFIVTLQIIFTIVAIAVIVNVLSQSHEIDQRDERPRITVSDLGSGSNSILPQKYAEDISLSLTSAMELNTTALNVPGSSAVVREESILLRTFDNEKFNALSFIVDIPDLKQSYQIYYKYPSDVAYSDPYSNNPRAVLCLEDESQIIYPDFKCRSSYPPDTRERIAKDYLNFLTFVNFSASFDAENPSLININPVPTPDSIDDDYYISELKSVIETLGVSPEIFEYHVIR